MLRISYAQHGLSDLGWPNVDRQSGAGDRGIDLRAERAGQRRVVQCKYNHGHNVTPTEVAQPNGRGRVFDNIVVERLWRTVKYEDISLHDEPHPQAVRTGLDQFFHRYNDQL